MDLELATRIAGRVPDAGAALAFIHKRLGMTLWERQQDVVREVFGRHRITAVRSCHASGKTYCSAGIALAWLFTGVGRTVITSAPTARQVKELLWKEIRVAYKRAGGEKALGGYMPPADTTLRLDDGWLAIGFSSDNPVNVQGWHCAGGTLVILDEAAGVEPGIWEALHGVMTGCNDRLLAIANPTTTSGEFRNLFRLDKPQDVARLVISAFDTPNVMANREVVPGLVTREWVEEAAKRWGVGSPMYRSRVLGEFPEEDDHTLVPQRWLELAAQRWEALNQANGHGWQGPFVLGVDVARYGSDNSVIAVGNSQGIRAIRRLPKMDTTGTAGMVAQVLVDASMDVAVARVDADGLGAGVFDQLRAEHGSDRTREMRGGMAAKDPAHFVNNRAEWFWNLRQSLDPSNPNAVALPPDEDLQGQLSAIRWSVTPKGQVRVETKEEMRARGMPSPDEADAVAYALAKLDPVSLHADVDLGIGRVENGWVF